MSSVFIKSGFASCPKGTLKPPDALVLCNPLKQVAFKKSVLAALAIGSVSAVLLTL
jgi:hypothetical protein